MPDNIPSMMTFEVSLQRSRVGNAWMHTVLIVRDGNDSEERDLRALVEEFMQGAKTGGYINVFDMRRNAPLRGSVLDDTSRVPASRCSPCASASRLR